VPALNNLAIAYRDARQPARAESLFRRAVTYDSTIAALYFGIHSAQLLRGNFAGARATLDLVARRFEDNPVRRTVEIQDAAAQQDWARAERQARAKATAVGNDTARLVDPVEALAGLAMTQGRLAEAERLWRRQLTLSRAADAMAQHLFGLVQLAYLELVYRNDTTRARALVDSALTATPLDSLLRGDRPHDRLARFYAAAGDLRRARALLRAAVANDRSLGRDLKAERSWTRGVVALAEGRTGEAEAELRQAAGTHVCPICPLPDLARAYEAAGKRNEAVAVYDRYLTTPWLLRYEPDAVALGWATRRLAALYDERGDRENAARVYARLLALWRQADPPLRPVRDSARARLTLLGGGG
jgi:tetratricopeptide (TPR) repeat protein